MIQLTNKPIEIWKVLQSVVSDRAGALVHFIGTVRNEPGIEGLCYECYTEMTEQIFKELAQEARQRWSLEAIALVHRVGWVAVGEPSVVIAVSAPHRREAFDACQFLIDQLKEISPIWKGEKGKYAV